MRIVNDNKKICRGISDMQFSLLKENTYYCEGEENCAINTSYIELFRIEDLAYGK